MSCSGDFFPSSNAIVSITISPTNGLVAPGSTTQFSATGTLGNNQTEDVTTRVKWTTSNSAVATINSSGLAKGIVFGNVTVKAASDNATSTTTLLVDNITTITVTANGSTSLGNGGTVQLKAKDNSGNDITNYVTWTSSDTSSATVSSTGLVTAVGSTLGTVNITATIGSASAQISITIT